MNKAILFSTDSPLVAWFVNLDSCRQDVKKITEMLAAAGKNKLAKDLKEGVDEMKPEDFFETDGDDPQEMEPMLREVMVQMTKKLEGSHAYTPAEETLTSLTEWTAENFGEISEETRTAAKNLVHAVIEQCPKAITEELVEAVQEAFEEINRQEATSEFTPEEVGAVLTGVVDSLNESVEEGERTEEYSAMLNLVRVQVEKYTKVPVGA